MPQSARPVVAVMDQRILEVADLGARLRHQASVLVEPDARGLATAHAAVAYQDRPLDLELLAAAGRLVVVTHLGTAIHVDVEAASARGIVVLHNPGCNAQSVAEHSIGILLALLRRIPHSDRTVRTRADWRVAGPELVGHDLGGKTIGILGYGAIGRIVASIASAGFGMTVIVYERNRARVTAAGFEAVGLEELLSRADVVSVHLPLTDDTRHLLDATRLAQMKPEAVLVNTARAEVIDYDAMYEALVAGRISGAAFDTWPGHRANPDSPLIDLDNVVMTQHNAGLTVESAARMADAVVEGPFEVLAGRRPTTARIVNPGVWDHRRRADVDLTAPGRPSPSVPGDSPGERGG